MVDSSDRELGFCSKEECHRGDGILHRAFSVFLFDESGRVLLQQRSASKPLWPMYWSNSCCSHPRQSETVEEAAHRRVLEELALTCDLRFLYKFEYRAPFGDIGTEHELCWVFAGYPAGKLAAHPEEIAAWRYVEPGELTREITARPEEFTPWLKLEWATIRNDHLDQILADIASRP
jgi:isopentenyl-diphosphate delta-isomerase